MNAKEFSPRSKTCTIHNNVLAPINIVHYQCPSSPSGGVFQGDKRSCTYQASTWNTDQHHQDLRTYVDDEVLMSTSPQQGKLNANATVFSPKKTTVNNIDAGTVQKQSEYFIEDVMPILEPDPQYLNYINSIKSNAITSNTLEAIQTALKYKQIGYCSSGTTSKDIQSIYFSQTKQFTIKSSIQSKISSTEARIHFLDCQYNDAKAGIIHDQHINDSDNEDDYSDSQSDVSEIDEDEMPAWNTRLVFREHYVPAFRAGTLNRPFYLTVSNTSCCIMPTFTQTGYCCPVTVINTTPPLPHFLQIEQHIIIQPTKQTTRFISTGNYNQSRKQTLTHLPNQQIMKSQVCMSLASIRVCYRAVSIPPVTNQQDAASKKISMPNINVRPAMVPLKVKTLKKPKQILP